MSKLEKGQVVTITITTKIDDIEDYGNFVDGLFDDNPFIAIKYADGYTLELPQYKVGDTKISVERLIAVDPKSGGKEE